jgi:peptidoglycan/LPS O-acetylase OafA/YrhL
MSVDLRPPVAPTSVERPSTRRADIQGLRAIAVLLVVAFHAKLPVPGGFVGVDVFFVISGFVITAMLMREWATNSRISFRRFYLRRFLRLTPALALTVAVVALVSILLQNPFGAQQTTARTGLGAMLLAANFVIAHAAGDYFATDTTTNPLLNTWSLSVEEQFYLIFPAVLAFGWTTFGTLKVHARRRLEPVVIIVLAIALGSFALSVLWTYGSPFASGLTAFFGGPESFAFYSPFTRAWEFAVGALLALLLTRLPHPSSAAARLIGLTGATLIVVAALTIRDTMAFPGMLALVPVAGTAMVIWAGSWSTVGVNRALAIRPMVAIGDASYSWYLWHWPVIVFAALLFPRQPEVLIAAALLSLVPAILSYRFLEQPIRRLRPKTRPRTVAVIVTTVGIPLAVCAGLMMGANSGWGLLPPTAALPVQSDASSLPNASGAPSAADSVTAPAPSAGAAIPVASAPRPAAPSLSPAEQAAAQESAKQDGAVAEGEGGSLRSQHIAVRNGCVNTDISPVRCRFGPANPIGTVLLAGDSEAYAVADGTVAAATKLGYDTIVTSHTGCPFLARESSGSHDFPCRSWQKSIVAYALKTMPAAVLIANRSAGYVNPEWGWRTAATDTGGMAGSVKEAAALWRKGLDPLVSELTKAGIPVVIIAAVPEMRGYTNGTTIMANAFGTRDFSIPRADVQADRQPALDVERSVAASYPGAFVFDPFPALCDADNCWAVRGGQIQYQDETHLSVEGSLLIAAGLSQTIRDAVAHGAPRPVTSSTTAPSPGTPSGIRPSASGSPTPPR